jgi:hypothetical protein
VVRTRFLTPFLLGAALVFSAQAQPPDKAPDVIEPKMERTDWPALWVSARAAVDPQTVLNWDLVGGRDGLRKDVERQREKLEKAGSLGSALPDLPVRLIPEADCEVEIDLVDDRGGPGSSQSLADLTRNARTIYRGVLRSVDPGFSSGVPSSLLTVEVSEVIKGSPGWVGKRVFVDHPVAHFAIGPFLFCNATKGFEPVAGDAILLFDYTGPIGRGDRLFAPSKEQVFFESRGGGLFLPERLRHDQDLAGREHLDEIVGMVRLKEGEEP